MTYVHRLASKETKRQNNTRKYHITIASVEPAGMIPNRKRSLGMRKSVSWSVQSSAKSSYVVERCREQENRQLIPIDYKGTDNQLKKLFYLKMTWEWLKLIRRTISLVPDTFSVR